MLWTLIRSVFFLLPAELAHDLSKTGMKFLALLLPMPRRIEGNRIGLAAGFDKNCEVLHVLPKFGFGHAEIGTVTPKPQGGNPRPRLFRNPKDQTLFNRMGFNNLGAGLVAERLRRVKPLLPEGFVVGVNLGKNKNTPDEEAASDYAKVARAFLDTADYFVINVSSPNTPGLRALQTVEALTPIVKAVRREIESPANFSSRSIPVYVKLAPELTGDTLKELLLALADQGINGFVLTNTQAGHYIYRDDRLPGGWSGQNLTSIAFDRLTETKKALAARADVRVISVGGIFSEAEAVRRIRAGADALQIYTGWIYQGPFFPKRIARALKALS